MTITINEEKNVIYVILDGELTGNNVLEFKEKVYPLFAKAKNVVAIDLGKVSTIDSMGIGSLVSAKKAAKQENKEIIITELNPKIEKFFLDVGLQNFFSKMSKKDIELKFN